MPEKAINEMFQENEEMGSIEKFYIMHKMSMNFHWENMT